MQVSLNSRRSPRRSFKSGDDWSVVDCCAFFIMVAAWGPYPRPHWFGLATWPTIQNELLRAQNGARADTLLVLSIYIVVLRSWWAYAWVMVRACVGANIIMKYNNVIMCAAITINKNNYVKFQIFKIYVYEFLSVTALSLTLRWHTLHKLNTKLGCVLERR